MSLLNLSIFLLTGNLKLIYLFPSFDEGMRLWLILFLYVVNPCGVLENAWRNLDIVNHH